MPKCPGQDQRFWKPDDIFDVKCTGCGQSVEFFKDEAKLKCRKCGKLVINPKISSGCAEWCQYADQCLAATPDEDTNILCNDLIDKKEK